MTAHREVPDGIEVRVTGSDGRVHAGGTFRESKVVCTRSFSSTSIPGYEGEKQDFNVGRTYVDPRHPAVAAHPDHFAQFGTATADRAIRSANGDTSREHRKRKKAATKAARQQPPPPPIEVRSGSVPPWKLGGKSSAPAMPHIPRARAVVGEGIYDLRNVSFSLDDPQSAERELRDRAMRAIERAKFPHGRANADSIRGHLAHLIDAADGDNGALSLRFLRTGSAAYRDMFARAARGGYVDDTERRAMSLDGPSGGFAVPFYLDPTIIPTSSPVTNPLRAISRVERITTDTWKGVGSNGVSAARYRKEGTEVTEDGSPEFTQPEAEVAGADWWAPAAYEITQDFAGLEPALAGLLQRAQDELEAEKFLTGTGEDEPAGLLTGATKTTETEKIGVFAPTDLEALEEALPPGFLERGEWLGSRTIFNEVKGFNVEGAAPIWVKMPGERPEINGLTARALSTMEDTIKGGESILVLGDFAEGFLIIDRLGMTVKFFHHLDKGVPSGQMDVYAMWRNTSKVLAPNAFRVLVVKES
jgi:HK97 family phage major capsid protein